MYLKYVVEDRTLRCSRQMIATSLLRLVQLTRIVGRHAKVSLRNILDLSVTFDRVDFLCWIIFAAFAIWHVHKSDPDKDSFWKIALNRFYITDVIQPFTRVLWYFDLTTAHFDAETVTGLLFHMSMTIWCSARSNLRWSHSIWTTNEIRIGLSIYEELEHHQTTWIALVDNNSVLNVCCWRRRFVKDTTKTHQAQPRHLEVHVYLLSVDLTIATHSFKPA